VVLATPATTRFAALRRCSAIGAILGLQLVISAGVNPAFGWGNVAHRAIAAVSEQHLTPETAKEVRRLLALEGAGNLADVVMWADQIRRQEIPGTPDHDVGIPLDAEGYDAARDCQTRCIVGAITFYLEILADRSKPDRERLEALKYVAHLVGDVHQPLHASQDGGGQMVVWNNKTVYLHILWDVTILAGTYPNPDLLAPVIERRFRPLTVCGNPEQWANESHHIAKTFVFSALGSDHRPPIKISDDYAGKALPMIEERVTLAAMRLSCVLNGALDHPGMSRR
jgi:nuclease S1